MSRSILEASNCQKYATIGKSTKTEILPDIFIWAATETAKMVLVNMKNPTAVWGKPVCPCIYEKIKKNYMPYLLRGCKNWIIILIVQHIFF